MKSFKAIVSIFFALLFLTLMSCNGDWFSVRAYRVGDIVLNDGSYLRDVDSISEEEKAKAIAVIYKVDGNKAYGIGIDCGYYAWCLSSANGYKTNFIDIECNEHYKINYGTYFTGDADGSDNFEQIAKALGENDDTEIEGNYPAFEFAKNYKDQPNSHVSGTEYETGWYLPSLPELYDIWTVKKDLEEKLNICASYKFSEHWCWSSTQYSEDEHVAYELWFRNGVSSGTSKHFSELVCCIRIFSW